MFHRFSDTSGRLHENRPWDILIPIKFSIDSCNKKWGLGALHAWSPFCKASIRVFWAPSVHGPKMSPGLANYRGTPGIFGWWIRNPRTVLHKSHIFHSVGPTGSNTKVTIHLSLVLNNKLKSSIFRQFSPAKFLS